jgi:hypothetical protein
MTAAEKRELIRRVSRLTIDKVVYAIRMSPRKSDQEVAAHIEKNLRPVTLEELRRSSTPEEK